MPIFEEEKVSSADVTQEKTDTAHGSLSVLVLWKTARSGRAADCRSRRLYLQRMCESLSAAYTDRSKGSTTDINLLFMQAL